MYFSSQQFRHRNLPMKQSEVFQQAFRRVVLSLTNICGRYLQLFACAFLNLRYTACIGFYAPFNGATAMPLHSLNVVLRFDIFPLNHCTMFQHAQFIRRFAIQFQEVKKITWCRPITITPVQLQSQHLLNDVQQLNVPRFNRSPHYCTSTSFLRFFFIAHHILNLISNRINLPVLHSTLYFDQLHCRNTEPNLSSSNRYGDPLRYA